MPNIWVLRTVRDQERRTKTVDSYNDVAEKHYNYDTLVPNSKRVAVNDYAIIVDKASILGFAKIGSIESSSGRKTVSKCPICGSSGLDPRVTITPRFRCSKGHTFNEPLRDEKSVTRYSAQFESFLDVNERNVQPVDLRPFYSKGYNRNNSIQLLGEEALSLFPTSVLIFFNKVSRGLAPFQGWENEINDFSPAETDERVSIFRAIKARRGQKTFRDKLRRIYGEQCMVTGCRILDILEAAHIVPYRGSKDNHAKNGLLLRADIHTLFDLNLLAINPSDFVAHFHPSVKDEYAEFHQKEINGIGFTKPSRKALKDRWDSFQKTLND